MHRPNFRLASVILAALLLAVRSAGAEVSFEATDDGTLLLPPEPVSMAVMILPACAPPGDADAWATRLANWGYVVLLFEGTSRALTCEPTTLDRATLDGFRRASLALARRVSNNGSALVAMGWDTRRLIHAAASVFDGRDLFRAIVSLGADVPSVHSPLPMYRGEGDSASAVRNFLDAQRAAVRAALERVPVSLGHWVEDPKSPGPDLPPVGASLFDQLYSEGGRHRIPFPFDSLLDDLNRRLGPEGSAHRVLHVLIPRGRSLQRNAAPDEENRFPRVVLGVDRFPDETDDQWRPVMRDRLFIAYQELEATLEIISFNADAGRFEFQVAHDYRPGSEPRVAHPPRRLCMSCHQNAGPLFPQAPWGETADNPVVAARIRAVRAKPYGLSVPVADNQALLIDTSTDRGNLYPLHALIWRTGCGNEREEQVHCRAAAFSRMIQYRLSGRLDFDREDERYREDYVAVATRSWRAQWPRGLHLPDADIPNRDVRRDGLEIGLLLDPLRVRPPLATWTVEAEGLQQAIRSLAGQLPEADLVQLDRFLSANARGSDGESRTWRAACRVKHRFVRLGAVTRVVDCRSDELQVRGTFAEDTRARPTSGTVDTLILGRGRRVGELVASGRIDGAGYDLSPWGSPYGVRPLPAQLVDGLAFRWHGDEVEARLRTVGDFQPVSEAIAVLGARALSENPFADGVFRPRHLLRELLAELAIPFPRPSSSMPRTPSPRLETVAISSIGQRLTPFVRHCAPCHAGPRSFPPPFLSGGSDAAARNIAACASRIVRRLSMWHLSPGIPDKTTMPPPVFLDRVSGTDLAVELLAALSAFSPGEEFDTSIEYSALRPCM